MWLSVNCRRDETIVHCERWHYRKVEAIVSRKAEGQKKKCQKGLRVVHVARQNDKKAREWCTFQNIVLERGRYRQVYFAKKKMQKGTTFKKSHNQAMKKVGR